MQVEYELRILNINKREVIDKLEVIGATKVHDEVVQKRYIMDFADNRLHQQAAWLRLRQVGNLKVECQIKQRLDNTVIRNAQEIQLEINNLEAGRSLFEFLGLEVKRSQENKRIKYQLGKVFFDIDTWPGKKPYIEIESDNEASVWQAVKKLGFKKADCTFTAGPELLSLLGFSEAAQKNIRFM